uniref:Uncharacterized protein n=1 Tax=Anopheles atroparvus TaxID=41427 RepID=A0A8W7NAU8_ANOAO
MNKIRLFVVTVVVADETKPKKDEAVAEDTSTEPLPVAAALHRQKRHEIEIHRVIKRRPKLPPPPRGRKPRPPRRPASKPRVKYGPPSGPSYKPLSHYVPQSIDEPYNSGFEASFADHHGSFGEPPAGYGSPIHPSPTFGSPPFAYGQTITSYEGSSFGKPSSYEGSSFGKPSSYEGPSFGKHGYQGTSSSSLSSFPKPSYESSSFDGSFSKANFGNGPSIFDSKVPSFADTSSNFNNFNSGSKHSSGIGGYSHSFSHSGSNGKQPSFADSTAINTYTTPSGKGNYYTDVSSFGDIGSKHHPQLPLETHKKDPYKTPLTSYEVPSNPKSNLFEPSGDFDTSYKRTPHTGGVTSTHSTSHSTVGSSEEEPYIPSLPTRYDQEQFHTPTKTNPNKPPVNTLQTIGGDHDHFTSFTSYYDGASESQKVPVKSNPSAPAYGQESGADDNHEFPSKRLKNRRKKKPKFPGSPIAHNLDTDDLRDAFGSSSDFHQVAIDADEFLEFEPKKQSIKHSKPAGVTLPRAEDSSPSNFVLLSSQNKGASSTSGTGGTRGESTGQRPSNTQVSSSKSVEYDLSNYFQASGNNQGHRSATKPTAQDDLSILSIQKSNSKSYYAGSNQAGGGFQPTRRRDMTHYRSAPSSLDYTMLDEDDDENYDEISDIGTRVRGNRKKKDLSEKPAEEVV